MRSPILAMCRHAAFAILLALFGAASASDLVSAQSAALTSNRHYLQWQHFHQPRAYPGNTIPAGAYRAAAQDYARKFGIVPGQAAANINVNTWTPIGPAPINPGGLAVSGRINSIAIDPTNTNIIYIAAATGGV